MSAAKDVHRLIKNIGSLTDQQASVEGVDWEDGNVQTFIFVLRPNSGYYKGGRFEFKVILDDQYPSLKAPKVQCLTDIFHPNIVTCEDSEDSYNSNVCLNLLDTGTWNPAFGLETIALGLLFLLKNPNIDSVLNDELFDDYESENFEEDVKRYMRGEEVGGAFFNVHFFSNVTGMPLDTSRVSSCDMDAMNMMCDNMGTSEKLTKQQSTCNQSQGLPTLHSSESLTNNTSSYNNGGMKLVSVDSDVLLLNDFCNESRDSHNESECEMDTTEVETGSGVNLTDTTCVKRSAMDFAPRGNLVKHSSFFFTNPELHMNSNRQMGVCKLTRTLTA